MLGYSSHIPQLDKYTSWLIPWKVYTIAAYSNVGKAQPLRSNVLTSDGFKRMWDIRVWDMVIWNDWKEKSVLWIPYEWIQDVYKITLSDGRVCYAWKHHEFRVRYSERYHSKEYWCNKYRYIEQDIEVGDMLFNKNYHWWNKYIIDNVKPIELKKANLPIDPYLLWVILWDWYIRRQVSITSGDVEIINNCKLPEWDKRSITSKKWNCASYNICWEYSHKISKTSQYIIDLWLEWTKSRTKFIPMQYLSSSIEDRISLLQWLMDTDGCVARNGKKTKYEFDTISKKLLNWVANLVLSLWGKINISKKMSKIYWKDCWISYRLYFYLPEDIKWFRLERKQLKIIDNSPRLYSHIKSIEYYSTEQTKCITVEWWLYITDNYIVTHNSRRSYGYVNHMLKQGKKVIFISLEVDKWLLFQHLSCNMYGVYPSQLTDELIDPLDFQNLMIFDDIYSLYDIEELVMQEKPDMCVVDFVQNIQVPWSNGYEAMAMVAKKLQEIAIKSNTIMLDLSQLSNDTAREISKGNTWFISLKWAWEFIASSDVVLLLSMLDWDLLVTIAKTKFASKPEDPLLFKTDFWRSTFTYSRVW